MTPLETTLLLLATVAAVLVPSLWYAERLRYAFVLLIREGEVLVQRGRATPAFVAEVRRICGEHDVGRGWVGAVRQGRRLRLVFSGSLPEGCRQQLRNVWGLLGWGEEPRPSTSQRERR
jgi:hypothetical protein